MRNSDTFISYEGTREGEKDKVWGWALRNCGYSEWALKEGEQRGVSKLRKKEESQTQHGSDQVVENNSSQFAVLPYTKRCHSVPIVAFKKHDIRLYSKAG